MPVTENSSQNRLLSEKKALDDYIDIFCLSCIFKIVDSRWSGSKEESLTLAFLINPAYVFM